MSALLVVEVENFRHRQVAVLDYPPGIKIDACTGKTALDIGDQLMAWLIVSNDSRKGHEVRADQSIMDAHWQYELDNSQAILVAGSLRKDDRLTKTGSVLLLDLPTREAAEAFVANDPATRAGMRGDIEIRWLNVAILDRREQS